MTTRGERTSRADCGTREVRDFQAEVDLSAVEARAENLVHEEVANETPDKQNPDPKEGNSPNSNPRMSRMELARPFACGMELGDDHFSKR